MLSVRLAKVTHIPGYIRRCFSSSVLVDISSLAHHAFLVLHSTRFGYYIIQPLFSHLLPTAVCDLCKLTRNVLLTKINYLHLLPRKLPQCFSQLSKKHNYSPIRVKKKYYSYNTILVLHCWTGRGNGKFLTIKGLWEIGFYCS